MATPPPTQLSQPAANLGSTNTAVRPKTYFITNTTTPLGRLLLAELLNSAPNSPIAACHLPTQRPLFSHHPRILNLPLDPLRLSTVSSAVASATEHFSRIDVLIDTSLPPSIIGAFEEQRSSIITQQFEAGYFARVAILKAAIATMRRQRGGGHHVVVTGLTGAMGTPGLSMRCAADHALEGIIDSVAFEVAPFAVRCTVVEGDVESAVFGVGNGGVSVVPAMREYTDVEGGGQLRAIREFGESVSSKGDAICEELVRETVEVVIKVAGAENPPFRITVGEEAVEMIKERLKTISEELEEYLEASLSADIGDLPSSGSGVAAAARRTTISVAIEGGSEE
jgi:NAD(P)-dependent dehydrogenase (short-subunit alcohol dehydrogenase family)